MPRFSPMDGLLGLSIPYPEQCELAFVELGETIQKTFIESIEDYLAFCTERNEAPEKPFSGRFNLRLEPDIHRDAYIAGLRTRLFMQFTMSRNRLRRFPAFINRGDHQICATNHIPPGKDFRITGLKRHLGLIG